MLGVGFVKGKDCPVKRFQYSTNINGFKFENLSRSKERSRKD